MNEKSLKWISKLHLNWRKKNNEKSKTTINSKNLIFNEKKFGKNNKNKLLLLKKK